MNFNLREKERLMVNVMMAEGAGACGATTVGQLAGDNMSWTTNWEMATATGLSIYAVNGCLSTLMEKCVIAFDDIKDVHQLDRKGKRHYYLSYEFLASLDQDLPLVPGIPEAEKKAKRVAKVAKVAKIEK